MVLPAKSSQHAADRPCREGAERRVFSCGGMLVWEVAALLQGRSAGCGGGSLASASLSTNVGQIRSKMGRGLWLGSA